MSSARFASRRVCLLKCGVRLTSSARAVHRVADAAVTIEVALGHGANTTRRRAAGRRRSPMRCDRADRPIPLDERLLPRNADGEVTRRRFDRATFPPARPASTLLAIYPDDGRPAGHPADRPPRRPAVPRRRGVAAGRRGRRGRCRPARRPRCARRGRRSASSRSCVRIVGVLDDVWIPVSNFELRPFVGTVGRRPALVPARRRGGRDRRAAARRAVRPRRARHRGVQRARLHGPRRGVSATAACASGAPPP